MPVAVMRTTIWPGPGSASSSSRSSNGALVAGVTAAVICMSALRFVEVSGQVGVLVPQLPLEDLAIRVLRQGVHLDDVFRALERREALADEHDQLVSGGPLALLEEDCGGARFEPRLTTYAAHRDLCNRTMG